jgi:hypothetical protein
MSALFSARSRAVSVNDAGHVIGQDHHRAKLTDHEVWLALELRAEGLTYQAIADAMECPKATIQSFCSGRRRGQAAHGQRRKVCVPAQPDGTLPACHNLGSMPSSSLLPKQGT